MLEHRLSYILDKHHYSIGVEVMKKYLLLLASFIALSPAVVFAQSNNDEINTLLEEISVLEKEAESKRLELRALAFGSNAGNVDFITIGEDVTGEWDIADQLVILEQIGLDNSEEYLNLIEIYSFKNITEQPMEFYLSRHGVTWSRKLEPLDNDKDYYVSNETEYVVPNGDGFVKSKEEPKEILPQQEVFFRVTSKIEEPLGVYYLTDRQDYWKIPIHNTPEAFGEFIKQ